MAITSVDSFIRIFKFYQSNPLVKKVRDADGKIKTVTLADTFRANSLIYQDTVDIYLHSLTLDKLTQLSYDTDSDTIQYAMNAREKLSKYFSKVLYPGSYAYSTLDNAAIRKLMLDWSSTIKTIQDANRKVTNAYSLSSNDVDKAIRGFGIDFISSTTLNSLERRKNFLLKICDLYAIKGTPDSILQALNIIGLENIFIREAWMCKDVEKYNGDYELRIKWKAQKVPQEFDELNRTWVELNTHDDIYTTWDWFKSKIHDDQSTFDPHWFYTQEEIKKINNSKDTYIKLPSITPYFGIEFTSDLDRNIDSLENLFWELTKQFQRFLLSDDDAGKTIWVGSFPNRLSALECYTGLVYTLIRVDERIQYENFKSYLELNKFSPPSFEAPYEHFNLIYWMYQHKNDIFEISYNKLLRDYIPIKSNTYTSYENVLKWWLEKEVSDFERKGTQSEDGKWNNNPFIKDPLYIQPRRAETSETYSNFIELEWDSIYPTGRYSVECYNSEDGWVEVVNNAYIYESKMRTCVLTEYAEHGSEDINCFRIVIYHHPNNIPDIFFHQPFNFNGQPTNTLFDRVIRYNGPMTTIGFYDKDDPIRQAFINQSIPDVATDYQVISGYHDQQTQGNIRVTQIHDDIKAYYCHAYNYPNKSRLFEDKWMNINALFYNYVDWANKDYYDTVSHVGLFESHMNENRKWPINKDWNWAIDSKYYYVCYEANKWMRYPVTEFVTSTGMAVGTFEYGDRVVIDGQLRVYVGVNRWAVIDGIETDWDCRESDLLPNGRIKRNSKLSRTLAVGQIKNENIIALLHTQTEEDKGSEAYKEALRQLNQSTIEVYSEPYGNNLVTTSCYTYNSFLTYLYNARLTLDFTTGYIYPVLEGHVDDHCRVYLKCSSEFGKTIWIRFDNKRDNIEWYDCEGCENIYDDQMNLGVMLPPYTLPNRYDSLRMLDGRIFNYRKELLEAFENGQIPDDVNLVVVRAYKNTDGEYKETENKYIFDHPVIYKKVQVITSTGSLKLAYDWQQVEESRFNDVKLGINPDLIDWIETMFATNKQNYIDLVNTFAEAINSYLINELGIAGSVLDLIIASWSNSNIVKKIVNYYKPKRARLLFVSDALDSEYALSNGLDTIGITDSDYNYYDLVSYRWGNPEFDHRNLSKMNRQRIAHVINDYLPVEDTIYKDGDDSNKLFNFREIHSSESKIPEIEVYDELVDMNRQSIATRNGTAYAVFYAHDFNLEDSMTGFYYCISLDGGEKIYSNNSWYFQKVQFVTTIKGSGRIKLTNRWALFKSDNNAADKDNAYYVADQEVGGPIIDPVTGKQKTDKGGRGLFYEDTPWKHDDGTPMKYADCTSHDRTIDFYHFDQGNFITERFVKVGVRTIAPSLYFNCFDNEACNGFYYYYPNIHPMRNDRAVYYNLKGKMISVVDATGYYSRKDPTTGNVVSQFWCISDIKQIVDFNECDYFAFTTSLNSEVDNSLFDVFNNDFTKQFYKHHGANDNPNADSPSALVGCRISFLYDHPDLIRETEGVYSAEYDKYSLFRRNHLNTVQLKYEPVACLVSDGSALLNYFNHTDDTIKIHYGTEAEIDSNKSIKFTIDDLSNTRGAFKIDGDDVVLRTAINKTNNGKLGDWTISMRMKFNDQATIDQLFVRGDDLVTNRWYMITVTSDSNLFIDSKLRNDIEQKFVTTEPLFGCNWAQKITLTGTKCDVAEVGVWNYVLSNWYINIISNFRILRNRPEPNKSKTAVGANNYRPLYCQEQPRVVFDRWGTGLPENIVGGRLQEYFADKYGKCHEVNPLWANRLPHDVDTELIVKGAAYNEPSRMLINEGTEVQSNGDYITPDHTIQWWWMRYARDFRTGPIHHRPAYISTKHIINDPYPTVRNGQEKKGDYLDIGLRLDGKDANSINVFDDETYDVNTGFGFQKDVKVKLDNPGNFFKTHGSLKNTYILDLAQLTLDSDTFDNFIFHNELYMYGMSGTYSEFNGTWTHSKTVKSWREGDFKECYTKDDKFEAVFTYQKEIGYFWWEIRKFSREKVWETYFRTYVNARHNQNPLMKVYDLLNYHQIDLSNQKLCKWSEDDVQTFKDKCWSQIEQDVVPGVFGSNTWVTFKVEATEDMTHPGVDRYFDGNYYHMVFNDKWYKVEAESEFVPFALLPETTTPSGHLFAQNYLYIWIDNKWIRVKCDLVTSSTEKIPNTLWDFRKSGNNVVINVMDSSDAEFPEETFVDPDIIDIRETMWKLVKFNGINDWKWWEHMNEEFPYLKSVNNDVACAIASLQDTLWYKTFEVSAVGNYFKVTHSNGVVDFVTELGKDDKRVDDLKYVKIDDCSNV